MELSKNAIYRRSSIVAIKNTYEEFPTKFLLYKDKGWNCDFFINYPTADYDNKDNIKKRLSNELKISLDLIDVRYVANQTNKKYSTEHEEERTYEHSLYVAVIDKFNDHIKADSFTIDGKEYMWKSITEMKEDPNTYKVNGDVIDFVNTNIR